MIFVTSTPHCNVALKTGLLIENLLQLLQSGKLENKGVFADLVVDLRFRPAVDGLVDLRQWHLAGGRLPKL
jgi:hypothetical protein